ncbi:peroxisome assembly protein 12 [Venturia canescens]|uniref:peroxisome assembly protein 12 n=1 Tax=Venturia canescens TaxID=32260 RepID=UPI001C9BEC16|nr:peroxisome assembly protein 12 [Venturia canescens]XP_043270882.1 peroxisome assembly protein 12 [Venturia canescens]
MAEKGAHLTGTSYGKPTIFEIVAQESLASTLEPGFKKIFSFLATCNSERYGWVLAWADEAYLAFNAFLQNFYFKKYGGSFSETFYGLRRIVVLSSGVGENLSWKRQKLSILLLILDPYLRAKAEKYKLDEIDGRFPKTYWKRALRSNFIKTLRIYHYIREFSSLFYYVLYLSSRTHYPTPIYHMLSTTLTYSGAQQVASISEILQKLKDGNFHPGDGVQLIQRAFTRSLELGAFFLQFVQWWNQENYYTNLTTLPVPPAPTIPEDARIYKGLCPVCRKSRRIHTALAISGYVFCYQCILPIVRKHGICPVTNLPAKEDDLIRLYLDE